MEFCQEVPALYLLSCCKAIGPEIPYTVDDDVQLVCKYLQAYRVGKIDRIYYDDEKCQENRFSKDPILDNKDCHRLLQEYMPEHVLATKITQRLFIRCLQLYLHSSLLRAVMCSYAIHLSLY